MRIVKAPDSSEDGIALPRSVLHELASLIRCDLVDFVGLDAYHQHWNMGQHNIGLDTEEDEGNGARRCTSTWIHPAAGNTN